MNRQPFNLGDWLIDPNANTIQIGLEQTHLEPRAMDVLLRLGKSPNSVVTRDELFDSAWGGRIVGDPALNRIISLLRKALSHERSTIGIETVPKRGYRLCVCLPKASRRWRWRWQWGLAVAFALVASIGLILYLTPASDEVSLGSEHLNLSELAIPVTWEAGADILPLVSHDGALLAYSSNRKDDQWDIYVKDLERGVERNLTNTPSVTEVALAFSPEGDRLLIQRLSSDFCQFAIVSLTVIQEKIVRDCSWLYVIKMDWSAKLDLILAPFTLFNTPKLDLHWFDPATSTSTLFEYDTSVDNDVQPLFSPSGTHVAFRRGPLPNSQLHVVTVDGKNRRALVSKPRNITAF